MKNEIITQYNNIIKNYKGLPFTCNKNDFQQFINGLYQAEGTMGAYFPSKESLRVVFYFSIGQNYSPEALNLFLSLQKVLGIGRISLVFGGNNKPHIRYIVSKTEDIFSIVIPYLSLLYGQKKKDMVILKRIYELSINKLNEALTSEIIHLVYYINPSGQKRKISLADKLNTFNCNLFVNLNLEVQENKILPSKLFILGLFLGDGSIGFVFNSPPSRLPKFYVKIVFNFAAQNNNISLLRLIAKKMDLKPQIYTRKTGMMGLEYSGETVFRVIMPFLNEHID
jgi:hypothetical protein